MAEVKRKKKISLMYILGGGILKEDFILRHTRMIALIVILLFFYISNRYSCIMKIREMDTLQHELRDLKIKSLTISAQLTSNTRPSQVEELVKRQGLDLEKATIPPYKLKK
ncbi:MAG: hypothetical protein LBS80_03445 [Tannerella sp.]|jgi:cell division protein FtsL|nr:hypothetical protein [Tannerella sp.]